MSNLSVRLSKKEQIAQRRTEILILSSMGLSQQEISEKLGPFHISQQTVSRDLEWLEKNAIEYVSKNREQMAIEYRKVLANFYQLRKKAWEQFNEADKAKDKETKTSLYNIIASINNDIMNLQSVGDIIHAELLKYGNEQAKEHQEEMNKIIEQRIKRQAIF